jgi:hypothetical protein
MDKIVTDPLYLKCKRMVETCNKNQTEMAYKYLTIVEDKFLDKVLMSDTKWHKWFVHVKACFFPLYLKLEGLNG